MRSKVYFYAVETVRSTCKNGEEKYLTDAIIDDCTEVWGDRRVSDFTEVVEESVLPGSLYYSENWNMMPIIQL
jgi:hypothetical protein